MNCSSGCGFIVLLGLLSQATVAQNSVQPNVLVIIVDDLSARDRRVWRRGSPNAQHRRTGSDRCCVRKCVYGSSCLRRFTRCFYIRQKADYRTIFSTLGPAWMKSFRTPRRCLGTFEVMVTIPSATVRSLMRLPTLQTHGVSPHGTLKAIGRAPLLATHAEMICNVHTVRIRLAFPVLPSSE